MSTSPNEPELLLDRQNASASRVEAVAADLLELVETFEGAFSKGHVPSAFAERMAELRHAAERLVEP